MNEILPQLKRSLTPQIPQPKRLENRILPEIGKKVYLGWNYMRCKMTREEISSISHQISEAIQNAYDKGSYIL